MTERQHENFIRSFQNYRWSSGSSSRDSDSVKVLEVLDVCIFKSFQDYSDVPLSLRAIGTVPDLGVIPAGEGQETT